MIDVAYTWECLDCEEHGTGDDSVTKAAKHTKTTGHSVRAWGEPGG